MPGPCSLPNGSGREEYAAQWVLVCDYHNDCTPDDHRQFNKAGEPLAHAFITKREYLARRRRLTTGKT